MGFGEHKTEQLGGLSQKQQRHWQAPIDDDDDDDDSVAAVCTLKTFSDFNIWVLTVSCACMLNSRLYATGVVSVT